MRLGGLSVKAFCCVAAACARVKSFELNLEWNRVFAPLYPLFGMEVYFFVLR